MQRSNTINLPPNGNDFEDVATKKKKEMMTATRVKAVKAAMAAATAEGVSMRCHVCA